MNYEDRKKSVDALLGGLDYDKLESKQYSFEEREAIVNEIKDLMAPERKIIQDIYSSSDQIPTLEQFYKAVPFYKDELLVDGLPGVDEYIAELVVTTEKNTWELLTHEYVHSLAQIIEGQLLKGGEDSKKLFTVLELGAGDGKLSKFLNHYLSNSGLKVKVVATDDGSWSEKSEDNEGTTPIGKNVERCPYTEALKRYQPDIVVVSWMPKEQDWTEAIRSIDSVGAYILIGPPALTGSVETWESEALNSYSVEPNPEGIHEIQITVFPTVDGLRSQTHIFRRKK